MAANRNEMSTRETTTFRPVRMTCPVILFRGRSLSFSKPLTSGPLSPLTISLAFARVRVKPLPSEWHRTWDRGWGQSSPAFHQRPARKRPPPTQSTPARVLTQQPRDRLPCPKTRHPRQYGKRKPALPIGVPNHITRLSLRGDRPGRLYFIRRLHRGLGRRRAQRAV